MERNVQCIDWDIEDYFQTFFNSYKAWFTIVLHIAIKKIRGAKNVESEQQ